MKQDVKWWEEQATRYKNEVVELQGKHDKIFDDSRTQGKVILGLNAKISNFEIQAKKDIEEIKTLKSLLNKKSKTKEG